MNRKYFLWIILACLVSIFLILNSLWQSKEEKYVQKDFFPHPRSPFEQSLFGIGVVEPSSDNIYLGTPVNRLVEAIPVHVGQKVKKGDILIIFDNRDLRADLQVQKASLEGAEANLRKLEAMPRKEDVQEAEGRLQQTKASYSLAKQEYENVKDLKDSHAVSQELINRRTSALEESKNELAQAQAAYDRVKAGTWKLDLDLAKIEIEKSKASLQKIQTEIERTLVKAPIDGTVLQIKIHEGEMPPMDSNNYPVMVLGNIDELYLRVSINQYDAPYFNEKEKAVAYLQGDARVEFPLEFVKVEPFFVNKQSITNAVVETVDTRVFQVIYKFKELKEKIYVGQQMDVFIETDYKK